MTQAKKQDIIAKVTSFLSKLLDDEEEIPVASSAEQPIEMLTIRECTQEIRGLNEFTIRQNLLREMKSHLSVQDRGKTGRYLFPKLL